MRTRARITLAGLLLGATLVGGAAWATIPSAGGVIDGCYRTSTDDQKGQLRVVEDPASCRSNELAISWNHEGQTGAAGVDGRNGQDGAPGAKGEPGAAGADGTNGTNGAPGAKGDPCLATDPPCVGPRGEDGTDGTNGAAGPAGPQGPPGPGGGSLASLDTLDGISCNAAGTAGTIDVAYGPPPVGAVTLTCKPTATPTLTVAKSGAGSGTVSSDVGAIACGSTCSQSFTAGTVVTLTATPSGSDVFAGWSGACSGTAATCTLTVNAATSATASFAISVELTITQSGGTLWCSASGLGCQVYGTESTISSAPAGISCQYGAWYSGGVYHHGIPVVGIHTGWCAWRFPIGTSVTLTQRYDRGTGAVTWGGACAGASGASCTVQLNEAKSVSMVH